MKKIFWPMPVVTVFAAALAIAQDAPPKPAEEVYKNIQIMKGVPAPRLQLVILEDGIPKPVLSGGEEDLANLVLRLAISQMIAERAGQIHLGQQIVRIKFQET